MSDEDEYLSEESYEFEFEDEDEEDVAQESEEKQDFILEHKYYNAKGLKEESPQQAIDAFEEITQSRPSEEEDYNWIFKSYKQIAKIEFERGRYGQVLECIKKLINIVPKINGNYAEDSMNRILNNYSSSDNSEFVSKVYDIVIVSLDDPNFFMLNSDRLWLKVNISKLHSFLALERFSECEELIKLINKKLENVSETSRNSYALDVIAVEIELYSRYYPTDLAHLNQLYRKSMTISSAVTHPKIMGVIRECGAKVHFHRGNYEKARLEFYESFKSFDEAGSPLKRKILKYLILCSLLVETEVNPFESQETQTYARLDEYQSIISLIQAYDEVDIDAFYSVIDQMKNSEDRFVDEEIFQIATETILENLRVKKTVNLLKAYSVIQFDYICSCLHVHEKGLKRLILRLVNEGRLMGVKVNFVDRCIIVNESEEPGIRSYQEDEKAILISMRCLGIIYGHRGSLNDYKQFTKRDQADMEIDTRPKTASSLFEHEDLSSSSRAESIQGHPFRHTLLFNENPTRDADWLNAIAAWKKHIFSVLPEVVKEELSQKEQVATEQRAENFSADQAKLRKMRDFEELKSAGDKAISTNQADRGPFQTNNNNTVSEHDLLMSWYRELQESYSRLSTIFE
ncbi:Piso0_005358 [Millerozyma farinosa CBS 7064]|uniref:Piso0_005358 protein n=1 Tax=Pichia sorbitophila (strain ATCC MYA-4447 / BCRC 22081 / CBS 7064 / NBRC 10061 / NRRL Y-12695) TaxID=559304 RepID=G8Y4W6_PICSO|nr:Piso0_005358 [Millerozyma farinosa CBS 7064]